MSGFASIDMADLGVLVPWPDANANKYSRGKLFVVGGCVSYPGAAVLAVRAAQRIGAGYVEAACAPESVQVLQVAAPSAVARSWKLLLEAAGKTRSCSIGFVSESDSAQRCASAYFPTWNAEKPVAYVVGPGMDPRDDESVAATEAVICNAQVPVLIDGGALGIVAASPALQEALVARSRSGFATVLTPHGGEAKRLAQACDLAEGWGAADLAKALGAVVVLKGPNTVIADASGSEYTMTEGTAALAKAGTGDVLAGMIGSLLAQGLGAFEAAVLGATLHARAGNCAARVKTCICTTPEDVVEFIPEAITETCGAR